jgi:hypothetical protein
MAEIALQDLHERRVRLVIRGSALPIRQAIGTGSYEQHELLGPVLRIEVREGPNTYSLVLQQSAWNGSIREAAGDDCEFEIAVALQPSAAASSRSRSAPQVC